VIAKISETMVALKVPNGAQNVKYSEARIINARSQSHIGQLIRSANSDFELDLAMR
jgi:hypothetical protein